MTPIGQYHNLMKKACVMALGLAVLVSVVLISMSLRTVPLDKSNKADLQNKTSELSWVSPVVFSNCDWAIIQNTTGSVPGSGAGDLAKRFRLAGTFIAYGGNTDKRRAILDELPKGTQRIVSENEELGDLLIVRIFTDRIVIKTPAGEEQLWLSFTNAGISPEKSALTNVTEKTKFTKIQGKYGTQVGEHSWVLDRNMLVDYYNELMNEPQRLVAVFDSLKPIYDESRQITGYTLDVEGEQDFFDAIGWKQGDVVRSVNSMKMTSRYRAEYFIKEFVANRANAFLFDMERDGQAEKLVYRIR